MIGPDKPAERADTSRSSPTTARASTAPASKAAASKAPAKKAAAATAPTSKAQDAGGLRSGRGPREPSERDVRQSRFFKRAQKRAEKVLGDPEKLRQVAAEAADKSKQDKTGPLSRVIDELGALIRMVVAYARGHYRDVNAQTMVVVIAGLIYFVSPIDLVPDFVPGGYLDDVAVLGWVIRTVRAELDAFIEWENGQES